MTAALLIVIAIVALLALWFVSGQRKLVSQDELCRNAMSQIGVQQQSRWDALTALAELVKSYNEHEYKTLVDVISRRKSITGSSTAAEASEQEEAIGGVLRQINVVAERYPELKANDNFAKAMDGVNVYENQVRTSRMVYNDTVTKYNRLVRQFPDSLIAGLLRFSVKDYIKEVSEKSGMPSMKIS